MTHRDYTFIPEFGYSVTDRIAIFEDRDFEASYDWRKLETGQEMAFFHLTVTYATRSSLIEFNRVWKAWRPIFPHHLFMTLDAETLGQTRRVQKLGFIPLFMMPCTDGNERMLYVSFAK